MGLLKRKDPATVLAGLQEKARAKATKRGADVDGALLVSHELLDDAWQTLAVWPDRVELHHHGKVGSFSGKGEGVTTVPSAAITSVSTRRAGSWYAVQIVAGVQVVEYRTTEMEAEALVEAIRGQAAH